MLKTLSIILFRPRNKNLKVSLTPEFQFCDGWTVLPKIISLTYSIFSHIQKCYFGDALCVCKYFPVWFSCLIFSLSKANYSSNGETCKTYFFRNIDIDLWVVSMSLKYDIQSHKAFDIELNSKFRTTWLICLKN